MVILVAILISVGLFASFHPEKAPPKGELDLRAGPGTQVRIRQRVKPLSAIRFGNVVKQAFDYSCGSAALATVLDYDLGEDLTEKQVINGLLRFGDSRKIAERRAFSLLDMKKFVHVLGYKGVGYKADIEDLKTLGRPCIIPITIFKYRHFVVFRGIYKGHVFVADPWRGDSSFTLQQFKDMWYQNVIFVVYPGDARQANLLRLRDKDLRFIDEDQANQIVLEHPQEHSLQPQRKIMDEPGVYQWYKR
jgi:uncharacterized protein